MPLPRLDSAGPPSPRTADGGPDDEPDFKDFNADILANVRDQEAQKSVKATDPQCVKEGQQEGELITNVRN